MDWWNHLKSVAEEWFPGINADSGSAAATGSVGDLGERKAERFLKKQGMRMVQRGYRNHVGEIDLIGVDQKTDPRTIVFIEVKTRTSDTKGSPFEAVNQRKQTQITNTAMVYLKQNDLLECRFRFDIVGVVWPNESKQPQIHHLPNAFSPVGSGQMHH